MVTGLPVERVISEFHNDYVSFGVGAELVVIRYLFNNGFQPFSDGDFDDCHLFNEKYTYIVGVPSLQHEGDTHAIVLRFDANGEMEVYDPLKGTGCDWYSFGEYAQDNDSVCVTTVDIQLDIAIRDYK
jgi:hypothetical protein